MIRKGRLFTPGPTQLLPSAQLAMAAATMHHRTAEFRALYTRVLADLKTFVGTKNDVVLFTASGTGAMEAAVANLTSPGDKVLIVSAGKFGERWEGLAKAYGLQFETVRAPYGETVTPQQVREVLKPEHKVLYMQATESSTGVRHDVEGIARLVKGTDTLLVADAGEQLCCSTQTGLTLRDRVIELGELTIPPFTANHVFDHLQSMLTLAKAIHEMPGADLIKVDPLPRRGSSWPVRIALAGGLSVPGGPAFHPTLQSDAGRECEYKYRCAAFRRCARRCNAHPAIAGMACSDQRRFPRRSATLSARTKVGTFRTYRRGLWRKRQRH